MKTKKSRKIKIVEIEQCSGAESKQREKRMTFDKFATLYPHLIKKVDAKSEKPAWGKGWYSKGKNGGFEVVASNWDMSG